LKPYIGKGEIKPSLGRTREEALRKYPAAHAVAEKALARAQSEHEKPSVELMEEIEALSLDDAVYRG
jgi:hypothetical protein